MMKYASLPEGLSSDQFEKVVSEFQKILGPENVNFVKKDMARFAGDIIPVERKDHMPSAALFPGRTLSWNWLIR